MDVVYPFPETLLRVSQAHMARHRLLGFNLIRSNPKICGFNLTGMLDDAFVEPTHVYVGRPFTVEALLANEDTVHPGGYPAQFRVWGPNGLAWERPGAVHIASLASGEHGPLAVPVLKEKVVLQGPEGDYKFVP